MVLQQDTAYISDILDNFNSSNRQKKMFIYIVKENNLTFFFFLLYNSYNAQIQEMTYAFCFISQQLCVLSNAQSHK